MKKIVEILNIILLVALLFIGCENRKKTAQQKLMEGMPSSELIPIFIIPELTRGDECERYKNNPVLKINEKLIVKPEDSFDKFTIYPEKYPINVKITLLSNSCELRRGYGFCKNRRAINGSINNGLKTQSCDISSNLYITGNEDTFEICELNFDSNMYFLSIRSVSDVKCTYEILYY
jgi:hypothetical protein